jgi:hypothetical protein
MQRFIFLVFLLTIACMKACATQCAVSSPTLPTPMMLGVNIMTGQISESDLSNIHYEKYQEGWNQVAQESLFLSASDFRIGRVKTIHFQVPEHSIADIHLVYEHEATKIYETAEQISIYRYTDHLLHAVEHYQVDASGALHLDRSERLFWQDIQSIPYLTSHVLEDGNGRTELCYCCFYNQQGQLIKEMLVGNLSGQCSIPCRIEKDGYPLMNGIESYSMAYIYSEEDPELLLAQIEDNGLITSYQYDSSSKQCTTMLRSYQDNWLSRCFYHYDDQGFLEQINCDDGQGQYLNLDDLYEQISAGQIWSSIVNAFFSSFHYLQLSAHQTRMQWNAELKLPPFICKALERISKTLLGESTYLLMGPHFEAMHVDCYGEREINEKVRVTFINGILNTHGTMLQLLDIISESHGGVKVHYVFRPTEGWTWDILRGIMVRTTFTLGFRSQHAHLLAKMWRELIQEIGGVGGGGIIVHYAHSLGGSETDRARELLSPEEQKMIRVVTFGSSTLVRNVGFQSVINIVSVNDGVSSFFLEPLGHIRNYFDPNSNVHLYGSFFNAPYWPADHLLNGSTYKTILQDLGKQFLAEFDCSLRHDSEED